MLSTANSELHLCPTELKNKNIPHNDLCITEGKAKIIMIIGVYHERLLNSG